MWVYFVTDFTNMRQDKTTVNLVWGEEKNMKDGWKKENCTRF